MAAAEGRNRKRTQAKPTREPGAKGAAPAAEADAGDLLSMDQAIEMLKTTRSTFYRWLRSGKVKGMKVGRQWRFYKADIDRFLRGQEPRIELAADIGPLIEALEGQLRRLGAEVPLPGAEGDFPGGSGNGSARAARLMIQVALELNASDMHLAVFEDGAEIRCRVDGALHPVVTYDPRLHGAIIARWKTMAACNPQENRLPQDGCIMVSLAGVAETVDMRVSFMPAYYGEALTVRVLRRAEVRLDVDRLDFTPRDREVFLRHIEAPWGLIIVTGPAGCGKTTTLYTALQHLNRPEAKVMTIEDPVEYTFRGIVQIPIRQSLGLDFARSIRSILRSDPDVIMVGEIRNREVLELCFQAALTGHLVMSTLHTNDAVSALLRMVDIGANPFLVADATRLVVAQRLVRLLCPACSQAGDPDPNHLGHAEELARAGGLDWHALAKQWRRAVGCPECKLTGYRGRTTVVEMLEVTPEIGVAVRRAADAAALRAIAVGQGMKTMAAQGVLRAANGETTLAEVLRVAPVA